MKDVWKNKKPWGKLPGAGMDACGKRPGADMKAGALPVMAAVLLLTALLVCACGNGSGALGLDDDRTAGADAGADDSSEAVVISSKAGEVLADEARYRAYTAQASYEAYYIANGIELDWESEVTDGETLEEAVREDVLEKMETMLVVLSAADEYDASLSSSDEDEAGEMADDFFSESADALIDAVNISSASLEALFERELLYEKICDEYLSENGVSVEADDFLQADIAYIELELSDENEKAASRIAYAVKNGADFCEACGDEGFEAIETGIGKNNDDGSVFAETALSLASGDVEVAADDEKCYVIYCEDDFDEEDTLTMYESGLADARDDAANAIYKSLAEDVKISVDYDEWEEITFSGSILE